MSGITLSILIVDDQAEIREILEIFFLTEGHSINHAKNGREAVKVAFATRPDIVFLDVKMPVLDGFGALREIRKIIPEADVVMMTACPEVDFISRAFKEGAVGFLGKPFDMAAVKTIVEGVQKKKNALSSPESGKEFSAMA
ncbi:MAG: response regulator [Bacillota bacterium]